MNISIEDRWQPLVDELLKTGRYGSASEVADEAFRLMEHREAKLAALRQHIDASIARGGHHTGEDVMAFVEASLDEWERTQQAQ